VSGEGTMKIFNEIDNPLPTKIILRRWVI
jgi:hypothetical protein